MFVDLRLTPVMIPLWKDETCKESHRLLTFQLFMNELTEYLQPHKFLVGL